MTSCTYRLVLDFGVRCFQFHLGSIASAVSWSGQPLKRSPTNFFVTQPRYADRSLREKFGRFRILVIGKAHTGKTTILKNVCNSTEDPEIYDDQYGFLSGLDLTRY